MIYQRKSAAEEAAETLEAHSATEGDWRCAACLRGGVTVKAGECDAYVSAERLRCKALQNPSPLADYGSGSV